MCGGVRLLLGVRVLKRMQHLVAAVDAGARLMLPGKGNCILDVANDAPIDESELRGKIEFNLHAQAPSPGISSYQAAPRSTCADCSSRMYQWRSASGFMERPANAKTLEEAHGRLPDLPSMSVFGERMRWVTCVAAPILPADVGDDCLWVLGLDLKGGNERVFGVHDDAVHRSFQLQPHSKLHPHSSSFQSLGPDVHRFP